MLVGSMRSTCQVLIAFLTRSAKSMLFRVAKMGKIDEQVRNRRCEIVVGVVIAGGDALCALQRRVRD